MESGGDEASAGVCNLGDRTTSDSISVERFVRGERLTVPPHESAAVQHERLITGVAATLGGIAVVLTVVGVTGSPLALPVAASFAVSAALMYDQLSGRMAARVYERVERHARVGHAGAGGTRGRRATKQERTQRRGSARRQRARSASARQGTDGGHGTDDRGGFGAGPRETWTPPRDGATAREAAGRQRRARSRRGTASSGAAAGAGGPQSSKAEVTAASAYRTLGLDPGADQDAIKAAYREKVKQVHPDTDGGDEEAFMAVKDAYERLAD